MRRAAGSSGVSVAVIAAAHALAGCPGDVCDVEPEQGFECQDEDGDGYCAECCDLPGYPQSACALRDCDDDDPYTHPFAADWFRDDQDFDCNGHDLGGTGARCESDAHCSVSCNVTTATCSDVAEICGSGQDEDGDGVRDCDDGDCAGACGDLLAAACDGATAPASATTVDFSVAPSLMATSCSSAGARDALFRFDAPGGPGLFEVRGLGGWAHATLRPSCTGPEELACRGLDPTAPLQVPVEGDHPLYLWLSEPTPGGGGSVTFDWSFRAATCGDGDILPPESCDDGNQDPLDGCDDRCRVETDFDACSVAQATPLGLTSGSTRFGTSLLNGSCGGAGAPERLHLVIPPADGSLSVALYSEAPLVVYARSLCDVPDSELGCEVVAPLETGLFHIPVTAGVPVVLVVDGGEAGVSGAYDLTIVSSM